MVVPTRDGGADLRRCLQAARTLADIPTLLNFLVIDNGSTDPATRDYLRELAAMPDVRVVQDAGPFNWSRLNNLAARACSDEILLFMNDDVELLSGDWDSYLRHHLGRPDIGAVGCKLSYPDGAIQHAGIVFGPDGRTAHEGSDDVTPETQYRWDSRRSVSAVTGAFLATRRADFETLRGFDEVSFPIWFNDVDFCLRLRSRGLRILYGPEISAIHGESSTLKKEPESQRKLMLWKESLGAMRARWGESFEEDPSFNPHFVRVGRPFEAIFEPSIGRIMAHLKCSARCEPWSIGPPDRFSPTLRRR